MTLEAFILRLPGQEFKRETCRELAGETRALKNRPLVWLELGLGLTISIFLMEVELHKAGPIFTCKHNRIIYLRKVVASRLPMSVREATSGLSLVRTCVFQERFTFGSFLFVSHFSIRVHPLPTSIFCPE